MAQGKINVQAENIFPIIKQFLYSDQEIFLRELVSNAVDACRKLKALSSMGEAKGDLGDLRVEVLLDKKAKTITIRDNGLGMTGEEIEKYIKDFQVTRKHLADLRTNEVIFISQENFRTLLKEKALEAYMKFFKDNY